jgi:RNA polymerase sigma-70 factor (ECF subfamily)
VSVSPPTFWTLPVSSVVNEHELVERCRQGDREAQRELYARTSDRVYGLLLRMTGNADDAADLAQDTYLRAFRGIGQFRETASVATWVYQIALNEARQFLRRRKRREEAPGEMDEVAEASGRTGHDPIRLDIEEALARLPEGERTLIVLRHLEGLSYQEMARVLAKPAGTIASGLNRARQMLREQLGSAFSQTA